ncbi:DUF3275 family protein [Pseudomonas aeruginosa]|nr:DUF3275 family protein [Pseudomonas aeruginosa]RTB44202.1 DUF3275 family protein [Pseudomonas aeruginosa]
MPDMAAAFENAPPLVVIGRLTIRTISGRNGPFTIGRLVTPYGKFSVKDPALEQYPEGSYLGQFLIRFIFPKAYPSEGGIRIENRVNLDGMTLYGVRPLSRDEAFSFVGQDDPLDEESASPLVESLPEVPQSQPETATVSTAPSMDTTPFGGYGKAKHTAPADAQAEDGDDAALFGLLWPLGETVRLDSTIDRRTLRSQIARLGVLGYALDFKSQEWQRQSELQPF